MALAKSKICPEWNPGDPVETLTGLFAIANKKHWGDDVILQYWQDHNFETLTQEKIDKITLLLKPMWKNRWEDFILMLCRNFGKDNIVKVVKHRETVTNESPKVHLHGGGEVPRELFCKTHGDDACSFSPGKFEQYVLHPNLTSSYQPR